MIAAGDDGNFSYRLPSKDELEAHFAEVEANLRRIHGDLYDGEVNEADLSPAPLTKDVRYRWRYFAPGSEGEDYPEDPTFVVIEDTGEPEEYSGFQDFAYDDFGLVDVMAFSYEPEGADLEAVPGILEKLRMDPRMIEDSTVEL